MENVCLYVYTKLKAATKLSFADDTFYLPSGSFDGTTTGKHLYGIFTSSQWVFVPFQYQLTKLIPILAVSQFHSRLQRSCSNTNYMLMLCTVSGFQVDSFVKARLTRFIVSHQRPLHLRPTTSTVSMAFPTMTHSLLAAVVDLLNIYSICW